MEDSSGAQTIRFVIKVAPAASPPRWMEGQNWTLEADNRLILRHLKRENRKGRTLVRSAAGGAWTWRPHDPVRRRGPHARAPWPRRGPTRARPRAWRARP